MKLSAAYVVAIVFFFTGVWAIDPTNGDDEELYSRVHHQNYQHCQRRMGEFCYDYIIVGAGTAGSIVARRLSDDPSNRVLLIEQGYWSSLIPAIQDASKWESLLTDPIVEIGYVSVPQTALYNRTIDQYRAKVTGGCGSHNGMVFIIGNRKDFDVRWGAIDGWTADDISRYWDYINSTVTHTQLDANNPTMIELLRGAEELGFTYNPNPNDLNSKQGQTGVSPRIFASKKISKNYAERVSSWNAYVEPILPRDNLDILISTHVNKIIFDKELTAIGIETFNVGSKQTVYYYAKREIILSAGVFDTPKLLLLSGIGPCQELKDLNVKCVSNVPGVGKNLQDDTMIDIWSAPLINQKSSIPKDTYGVWGAVAMEENGENFFILRTDTWYDVKTFLIYVEIFHYESRGTVKLRDNNPLSAPLIDSNYLSTSYDQKKLVAAIKRGRAFFATKTFSSLTINLTMEESPGYNVTSDEQILNWAKNRIYSDDHPVGTCKMGRNFKSDPMVVVDKRLRVRNTKNLRVADASIIPSSITGNPNQITMVIGFKAADMILQDKK